mmetsp:Transcript_2784/g.7488  ORF Transcript_2784/g.7488 Transcript_2784/m.7488 type:complete len:241 (-) Transcript_2784:28-750(-)
MPWSDFQCTGTEFHVDVFISDDRDSSTVSHWDNGLLANQVLITFIVWVYAYSSIPHDSLGSSCGNGKKFTVSALHHVPEKVKLPFFFGVFYFQVTHCCLQEWRPVDHVLATINQTLVVQSNKGFRNGFGQIVVHGESFASPIGRGSQRSKLASNVTTLFRFVFPYAIQKFFTTDFFSRSTFSNQLLFNLQLRRNTRMIRTWQPQDRPSSHPMESGQNILQGNEDGMPHMKPSCYIGWGHG